MSERKKAALFLHGPLSVVGGVERCNRYVLELLRGSGWTVDVIDASAAKSPGWVKRYAFPLVQYDYAARSVKGRDEEYDLLVTNAYTAGILKGPKVVNICYGTMKSYQRALIQSGMNWKLRVTNAFAETLDRKSKTQKAITVLSISEQVRQELWKDYGVQSKVIPCGIDTAHFCRAEGGAKAAKDKRGIPPGKLVGAFVGRWAWNHKGLDILMPLIRSRQDIHWVIATDVEVPCEGLANLTVLRNVPYEELPEVYSVADFTIQISRYESFGFSFVESLACAKPVITSPVGVAPETYRGTPLADLLISSPWVRGPRELEREIGEKINRLKNGDYSRQLSEAARRAAVERYGLETWKERMTLVFDSVLGVRG